MWNNCTYQKCILIEMENKENNFNLKKMEYSYLKDIEDNQHDTIKSNDEEHHSLKKHHETK